MTNLGQMMNYKNISVIIMIKIIKTNVFFLFEMSDSETQTMKSEREKSTSEL